MWYRLPGHYLHFPVFSGFTPQRPSVLCPHHSGILSPRFFGFAYGDGLVLTYEFMTDGFQPQKYDFVSWYHYSQSILYSQFGTYEIFPVGITIPNISKKMFQTTGQITWLRKWDASSCTSYDFLGSYRLGLGQKPPKTSALPKPNISTYHLHDCIFKYIAAYIKWTIDTIDVWMFMYILYYAVSTGVCFHLGIPFDICMHR